jgi:hypothetical protein
MPWDVTSILTLARGDISLRNLNKGFTKLIYWNWALLFNSATFSDTIFDSTTLLNYRLLLISGSF